MSNLVLLVLVFNATQRSMPCLLRLHSGVLVHHRLGKSQMQGLLTFEYSRFWSFFSKLVLRIRVTDSKAQGKCGQLGATSRLYWLDSYDYQRQAVVIYGRV